MAIALDISNDETPNQNNHFLNQWPKIMLEQTPWHFNQCAGVGAPVQTGNDLGGLVYLQTEREYIARHLESAAIRMATDLNYWICPAYFSELIPIGSGYPIQAQYLTARYCKMIELGTRATTLIQAGAAVVYSDPNSIGVNDTATITVVTGIANAEIKLYFQVADGAPTAGDYRYEIEPTIITDAAGTVTIKAHRALFVKPSQWAREYIANDPNFNSPNIVDTGTAAGFVTAVDVYRVYTATTSNVSLIASDGSTVLQTYTGEILDARLSTFRLGDFCADWCGGWPKFVRVNYKAGAALQNNHIDGELYEACVAMACADMDAMLSKMSYWALNQFEKWHEPLAEKMGGQLIPVATKSESQSKYGARTGQIKAWRTVTDRRIMKAHKLTMNLG